MLVRSARSFCSLVLLALGLASELGSAPEAQQRVLEDGLELSGFHRFPSVVVPAGATVWVKDDVVIEAEGDIVIDGELRAADRPQDSRQDGPTISVATPSRLIVSGAILGGRGGVAVEDGQQGPFGSHVLVESPWIVVDGLIRAGGGGTGGPGGKGGRGGDVLVRGSLITNIIDDEAEAEGGSGGPEGPRLLRDLEPTEVMGATY